MRKIIMFIMLIFLLTSTASADFISIQASQDSFVYEFGDGGGNFGSLEYIKFDGSYSTEERHLLIQFDLSEIPQGSTIINSHIWMYNYENNNAFTAETYRNTASWSEGTVTWNNKPSNTFYTFYSIDSGLGWEDGGLDVNSLVQNWLNGTWSNYGVTIWDDDYASDSVYTFRSSEYSDVNYRPDLVVEYTPPNTPPTVATAFTNLGNNLIDHTPTITWTEGTDADTDPVSTYVYVGTNSTPTTFEGSTTGETLDLGSNTTFTDGNTYYYRLRSYDGEDWSDYTVADEFRMNTPPTVATAFTNLGNNLIDHTPTITWTEGTDSEVDSVSTYIYVGATSTPTTLEGGTIGETIDLGSTVLLTDGNTYYYRLRSYDGYEWSDYTTVDSFRMNSLPTIPTTFTDLGAHLTDHTPTVTWTEGTDSEADTITTLIYVGITSTPTTLDSSTTSETIDLGVNTTLTDGNTFYYRLITYDGYEYSAYTTSDSFRMNSLPTVPTGFTNLGLRETDHTPTVSWSASTDGESDSITYFVESQDSVTDYDADWNGVELTTTLDANTWSDGEVGKWRVRAFDSYEYSAYTAEDLFKMNILPTTTDLLIQGVTNPQNIVSFTPTFSWTYTDGDNDTQDSYEINVGTTLGSKNMWDSGTISTTDVSDIYGGSALSRNVVYHIQVKTNDSYEETAFTNGTFKINSLPVVSNVTISPFPAIETDDLTALNDTVTDADGNGVTLQYYWYKDNVLQTALNNISTILASNISTDDVWKVGIIPFDSYENGLEVLSSTVTIGSSNYAPTLTGITTDVSIIKWNKTLTVSTVNANDVNGDNYTLSIGSSTGLSDICNSTSTLNGTEASCSFLINDTTGSFTLYGRLTDGNDTSVERSVLYTIDETPPVLISNSISSSSITNDESLTISASVVVADGEVDWVKVKIRDFNYISTNYTMNLVNGTYKYTYSPAGSGTYTITNFYASDDSGNIIDESVSISFEVGTGSTGGSVGGGAEPAGDINITIAGDLTLTPNRRDTYMLYTALSGEQSVTYQFVANRDIVSCNVEPNSWATCEIVDGYIIEVTLTANETISSYDGVLTIKDENDYVATSTLVVRVVKIFGALPIGNYEVGGFAELLSIIFETSGTAIIGIRTWVLGLIGLVAGYALYKVLSL